MAYGILFTIQENRSKFKVCKIVTSLKTLRRARLPAWPEQNDLERKRSGEAECEEAAGALQAMTRGLGCMVCATRNHARVSGGKAA